MMITFEQLFVMKSILIFTTICLLGLNEIFAQKSYIVNDSSMQSGIKLIGGTNTDNQKRITQQINGLIVEHKPDDITEYGLEDGRAYKSRLILSVGADKKVFLLTLIENEITLFKYFQKGSNRFFIEKERKQFQEITRSNYKEVLSELTQDNESTVKQIKNVRFTENSLKHYIQRYNSGKSKVIGKMLFGVIIGHQSKKLTVSHLTDTRLNGLSMTDNDPTIGAYIEIPIFSTAFSIHSGINYSKSGFKSFEAITDVSFVDGIINTSYIQVPVLMRYSLYTNSKWTPFVSGGVTGMVLLNTEAAFVQTDFFDDTIFTSFFEDSSIVNQRNIGITGGIGIRRGVSTNLSFAAEIRYSSFSGPSNGVAQNVFDVLFSVSF